MNPRSRLQALALLALALASQSAPAEGDPHRGAQQFRQCAACHSLEAGLHLTGPSLAGVVGRRAASAESFTRYSEALRDSGLTWDAETLDRWLAGPTELVPGTSMRVQPLPDPAARRDLIAFLAAAGEGEGAGAGSGGGAGGAMMGGMAPGRLPDLKAVGPNQQVKAITYCPDGYRVTLGTGDTHTFWEFNLRFKSDSSERGPQPGAPVIVATGMRGDRAQVVFAAPEEISAFIRRRCPG